MTSSKKVFTVKYKNPETGQIMDGQFTVRRLTINDRSRIGVKKSQLSSGMYCVRDLDGNPTGQGLDEDTDILNGMLAHLEVALEQKPMWFNLDEISEIGVVREVYKEVADFESSFFLIDGEGNQGRHGTVGQGDSNTEPTQANNGNNPTPVVDKQVQAALDA